METTIDELAPYMRGWRSYFGFCETPEVLIGLLVGFGCDSGRLCGGSGKHRAVAGRLCWNCGCESRWRAIQPVAVAALGISRRPRPWPWGFRMRTSNRWDFHHCARTVSVTVSNRRVRTRTHGGVAGGGAPLCGWRAPRPQVQEESRRAQLAELADDRLKPVPPYMARALRTARRSSERAGFFVAWVSRRTWALTHTRNMGCRAFFSKSTIRSGASSK